MLPSAVVLKAARAVKRDESFPVAALLEIFPGQTLEQLDAAMKDYVDYQIVARRKMPQLAMFPFAPPDLGAIKPQPGDAAFVKGVAHALRAGGLGKD